MGGRGNGGVRNTASTYSRFMISAESYGISNSEATAIERFINAAIDSKYEEDGDSIITNIKPKDRDRLAEAISQEFESRLGWSIDVRIGRKVEGGTRSRLKNGGMHGKTVYTTISYRRNK